MLFSARISTGALAGVSRRLATSLKAGLDIRAVLAREAQRQQRAAARSRFRQISDAVSRGDSFADALKATGDYFPPMFRELAAVGELTGHLDDTLAQLADHYDRQLELRRGFLLAILWPMIELTAAVFIIGFLIWVLGAIGRTTGTTIDVLGFGLVGNRGLAIYMAIVGSVVAAIAFVIHAINRGALWVRPVQTGLLALPVVGPALTSLALGRLAWSLHLTLNAGMDVLRAVRLSVETSGNTHYTDHLPAIESGIRRGDSLYDAFMRTGAFPASFMDVLHVGEATGDTVEAMGRLAGQYRDTAHASMRVLSVVGFFAVFGMVALFIILMIFRIFSFYFGAIDDALNM